MATQDGIIRIRGKVGSLTFYKKGDGTYGVRDSSGIPGNVMRTDKRFERTRENWAEFARAGRAARLLRNSLKYSAKVVSDGRAYPRLLARFMKIVKSDTVNERGKRLVENGDMSQIIGYEFNIRQTLPAIFDMPFEHSIDRATGTLEVKVPELNPKRALNLPGEVTHFRFVAAATEVDWAEDDAQSVFVEGELFPFTSAIVNQQNLSLTLTAGSTRTLVLMFGIWIYQEVNGVPYLLNNGQNNAMTLVGVDHI